MLRLLLRAICTARGSPCWLGNGSQSALTRSSAEAVAVSQVWVESL
jgi:hypothetical protein